MPQFRQENTAQYGTDTIRQAERHVHKTGIYKFSVTYGICHNACTPAGKRINQKEPAKFVKCIDQFIFPFLFFLCVLLYKDARVKMSFFFVTETIHRHHWCQKIFDSDRQYTCKQDCLQEKNWFVLFLYKNNITVILNIHFTFFYFSVY